MGREARSRWTRPKQSLARVPARASLGASFGTYEQSVEVVSLSRLARGGGGVPGRIVRVERTMLGGVSFYDVHAVEVPHAGRAAMRQRGAALPRLAARLVASGRPGLLRLRARANLRVFVRNRLVAWRLPRHAALEAAAAARGGQDALAMALADVPEDVASVSREAQDAGGRTASAGLAFQPGNLKLHGRNLVEPISWMSRHPGFADTIAAVAGAIGEAVCDVDPVAHDRMRMDIAARVLRPIEEEARRAREAAAALAPGAPAALRAGLEARAARAAACRPLSGVHTTAQLSVDATVSGHADANNARRSASAVAVLHKRGEGGEEYAGGHIVLANLLLDFPAGPGAIYSADFGRITHLSTPPDGDANAASGAHRVAVIAYTPQAVIDNTWKGRMAKAPAVRGHGGEKNPRN